jgi:hypothetical protein
MVNFQKRLENELEKLKKRFKVGYELKVVWSPNNSGNLAGEVKGETIYIYDESEKEALKTLKHEFLDYAISKLIEPYKNVTNKLIMLINEDAYKRKERLVESLCRLIHNGS